MNLLQRIKAAFSSGKVRNASFSLMQAGEGGAFRQPFSYDAAVRRYASWIYAAANLNAIAVASQPVRLYVRRGGVGRKLWNTRAPSRGTRRYLAGDAADGPSVTVRRKVAEFGSEFEMVTDTHPVLDLLAKVNPYQNGFDSTVLRVLYQELTGNAYLHPVIDETLGIPVELWTLPAQWVEIVPGKERLIDGYLYGSSRENRVVLPPEEVIHFRRPNPANLFYGLGKLEAAWGVAMQNEQIHEMDLHFFANKGRPDWLLTVKGDAHPDDLERLEAQIDEKLRGSKRTGRFLTATAEVDLKPLQFPPKDITGRDDVVEEIAAIFGVPVSMLKANDPNLASAQSGYAMWRETTVLPLLRMDEETLNQCLIPLFGLEDDAFLAYDNPVPADKTFDLTRSTSLVAAGIISRNEARVEAGMEPSDDPMADALLVNGIPLGGPTPPAAPMLAAVEPSAQPAPAELLDRIEQARTRMVETKAILTKPRRLEGETVEECMARGIPELIAEGKEPAQAAAIARSMCEGTKALEDIDTKPPQTVADNAARALEVRAEKPESMRGMTEVGIARARDLSNRVNLSEETIRRMAAYFERHQSDKDGQTWDEQGPGWQAWMGWGGDEGWAWARRKVEEFDRAREGAKSCGCGCAAASTKAIRASDLWTKGAADEFDAITERERLLSRGVGAVLTDQITEVIAEIRKAGAPSAEMVSRIERLITANRWNIALVDALRPYLADAMEVGVSVAVDTLRKVEGVPTFEPPTEQLAAFTQVESTRLARVAGRSVNEYTAVQIRDLVETGIEEGKTVDELAAKVQEWAEETGDTYRRAKDRAVRVARTEAQRAARSAEVETWAQTGMVEGKTWLLAPSPCEFCAEAAKRFEKNAVALDGAFFARGSTLTTASGKTMVLDYEDIKGPPLHPNCRCSLMPRLSDELERLAAKAEGSGAGARTVDAIMAEYERSKG